MTRLIFLLLWMTPLSCFAQQWVEPYFESSASEITVEHTTGQPSVVIYMDEEIEPQPFTMVKFLYTGTNTPVIDYNLATGDLNVIGVVVELIGSEYVLKINYRVDYETQETVYLFDVNIVGEMTINIGLYIQNTFDNPPHVSYNGPCKIDELLESGYESTCIFTVSDPDGLANNLITYSFNPDVSDTFELQNPRDIDGNTREYTVVTKKELAHDQQSFYSFTATFFDIALNPGSILAIIEVNDLPNMPPRWITPFSMARFDEKEPPQEFNIRAADGDTGIDGPICVRLEWIDDNDYGEHIALDNNCVDSTAVLKVGYMDRDALMQEIFNFKIIAYKEDNETWSTTMESLIILNDVNDCFPEIDVELTEISIKEEEFGTLSLGVFTIEDRDLGNNAMYTIELKPEDSGPVFSEAFTIVPSSGYQLSNFVQINVAKPELLDYDEEPGVWRKFDITIRSVETIEPKTKFREQTIKINLQNWNDEVPIFNETAYETIVFEDIKMSEYVVTILAEDADFGDSVKYEILGSMSDLLNIGDDGKITPSQDNVFDFERQQQVIVQIQATDTFVDEFNTPQNSAFVQLTINVLDVNDETPEIRMPRDAPTIAENSPGNTVVTSEIRALDPDTDADLVFEILWDDRGTYATKNGQEVDKLFYKDCFIITIDDAASTLNEVVGVIEVNPTFPDDIDYEIFEIVYLTIQVEDHNQQINNGLAAAILTIRITDLNDCAPEFIDNTLTVTRSVTEEALIGTQIGTVLAVDRDGPLHNKFTYAIKPITAGVPTDWVTINDNGVILVANDNINCDVPPLYYIEYRVILQDDLHTTFGKIVIDLVDTNNQIPFVNPYTAEIKIEEEIHPTGYPLQTISASDDDRDVQFRTMEYTINFLINAELTKYFGINPATGEITIQLQSGLTLDRDLPGFVGYYDIPLTVQDNYLGNGRRNMADPGDNIRIILIDINDNPPVLPDFSFTFSEDDAVGKESPNLCATDIDEGNNAEITYTIVSITSAGQNANPIPANIMDHFSIVDTPSGDLFCGKLVIESSLASYYGNWEILIRATDKGTGVPEHNKPLSDEKPYTLTIQPANLNKPVIVYPAEETIRLRFSPDQNPSQVLENVDSSKLQAFEASDPDGAEFGEIEFILSNVDGSTDSNLFWMDKIDRNTAHFKIDVVDEIEYSKQYNLILAAYDGGNLASDPLTISIVFIDVDGDPAFEISTLNFEFSENTTDPIQFDEVPKGSDPLNFGIEEDDLERFRPSYYFIDATYGVDANRFTLDKSTRILQPVGVLDREEIENHEIKVIISRLSTGPPNLIQTYSTLIIHIKVLDINDNPPNFDKTEYGVGITSNDHLGKEILTVSAIDLDSDDTLTYRMVPGSLSQAGTNIQENIATPFNYDPNSGVITLNFIPQSSWNGFFTFNAEASDGLHTTETVVKIYIIAESNRVTFVFLNTKEEVNANSGFIADVFEESYTYPCYIDDITDTTIDGVVQTGLTTLRAHFILNNEAIPASTIQAKSSDRIFITRLKAKLIEQQINLQDVPTDRSTPEEDTSQTLIIVLIVVSVVLGIFCIILIIAYTISRKKLNRMNKSSQHTFGSTPSIDGRRQMNMPTSNAFSEGTNTVLNGPPVNSFDRVDSESIHSEDSDFGKINNGTMFAPNENTTSVNPTLLEEMRKKSINPLAQKDVLHLESD